jgi:hypothetical protein
MEAIGSHDRVTIGEGRVVTVRHPEIRVNVVPEARNDFRIIDYVTKASRKAGVPRQEIDQFCDEALAAGESELLQICGEWVTVVP